MRLVRGLVIVYALGAGSVARAAELGGSPSSMRQQHAVAVEEHYTFSRTGDDVRHLAALGRLTEVTGERDFVLDGVSYPYTRSEVLDFVRHFAAEYRDSTGKRLVVTSLTRPTTRQPSNASALSVHPAGMAVDLRVPSDAAARAFLERRLLRFEADHLVDVTREKRPPHYHVAVFPEAWRAYAAAHPLPVHDTPRVEAPTAAATPAIAAAPVPHESRRGPFAASVVTLATTMLVVVRTRRRRLGARG